MREFINRPIYFQKEEEDDNRSDKNTEWWR